MAILRFDALKEARNRTIVSETEPSDELRDFGAHVFDKTAMVQYLPKVASNTLYTLVPTLNRDYCRKT